MNQLLLILPLSFYSLYVHVIPNDKIPSWHNNYIDFTSKKILIATISFVLLSPAPVFAPPPPFSLDDKFSFSDLVLTGIVLSIDDTYGTDTGYEIKVNEYLKGEQQPDVIHVIAYGTPDTEVDPVGERIGFHVGDKVYLFLNYDRVERLRVNPLVSYVIEPANTELYNDSELNSSDVQNVYDSPLKQYKKGISLNEIKCNEGLDRIVKKSDGSPACVKPDTKAKLVERSWTLDTQNMHNR